MPRRTRFTGVIYDPRDLFAPIKLPYLGSAHINNGKLGACIPLGYILENIC